MAPKKQEDKKEMPATEPKSADMAKLTPEQQRIAGFVSTAKKDAPRVDAVVDLFSRVEMEIPKEVIKGSEYAYAWLAVDNLNVSLASGSKWELVTRSNHSHVPDRFFGMDGGITYKGQNILAFCYRDIQEAEEQAIVKAYNEKTERFTQKTDRVKEGEVAMVGDEVAAGINRDIQESVIDPAEKTDFAEPL